MNIFRRPWQSCGITVLLVAVAAALRLWPLQALGAGSPWLTFYPAIFMIALYEGLVAGLLGTLLSCLTVLFLLPLLLHQPLVRDGADWLGLAFFVAAGAMISGVSKKLGRSRATADRKRAAEELGQAQDETAREKARLQFIFDSAPVGLVFILVEPGGGATRMINDESLRIWGITREQADEPGIFKRITHPEDRPAQDELTRKLDAGTIDHYSMDKRYVRQDGQIVWVFFSFQRHRYDDGSCDDLIMMVDITSRKQAGEALQQAQEETAREKARLQFVFDAAPVGLSFTRIEADGRATRMINDAHLRIWGITREQADEPGIFKRITHPDDWHTQDEFARQLDTGTLEQYAMDKRYIMPDGGITWVFLSFKQRNFPDGSREGLSVAVDITARKQAEEAVQRAQEETAREKARLQFVFEAAPVGLSFGRTEADGRTTRMINDAHLRIWGITREQLDEPGIFKRITHPDDWRTQEEFSRQLEAETLDQYAMDKRYIRPDGRIVWAFFSFKRWNHPNENPEGLSVVVDITARKEAEEALQRSEENLSVTLHSIGDGVLTTDAAGLVTRLNPIAEKMTGWTHAGALGLRVAEVFRIINETTRQPAAVPVDEVLATGEIHGLANHTVLIARDGAEWPIADSAAPIRSKDGRMLGVVLVFRDVTMERQAEKAIRENEQQLRAHNEELERRVRERTTELLNTNHELTAEIMKRNAAEALLARLNGELELRVRERTHALEESNKELEAFSYSVSHDLRAPLRHIQGYVSLLDTEAAKSHLSDKAKRYLKVIGESGSNMGVLIDDLLTFSKMGRTGMNEVPVELDGLVQESVKQLEMAVKGRDIVWKIPPLPRVMGDLPMLRQVFANLLGNAVKYTRPRSPAEIEIGCAGQEEGRIILFVRDNGVGFEMEYAQKLFGVFQRLHGASEFEGTGIGLANVRRIITRHGGRTWAEGEVDKGATFYFTLRPAEVASPAPETAG